MKKLLQILLLTLIPCLVSAEQFATPVNVITWDHTGPIADGFKVICGNTTLNIPDGSARSILIADLNLSANSDFECFTAAYKTFSDVGYVEARDLDAATFFTSGGASYKNVTVDLNAPTSTNVMCDTDRPGC